MAFVGRLGKQAAVIIVDEEMRRRIDNGDPFTLPLRSIGLDSDIEIVVGSAPAEVITKAKEANDIFKYVFRNYEIRPEDQHEPFLVISGAIHE